MSRAKKKLSLNRETLRVLNAVEIWAVAGAGTMRGITDAPGCEKSGVAGHCEQPSRWDNCGNPRQGNPDITFMVHCPGREQPPQKSQSLCLDLPPMPGYTQRPTSI